MLKNMDTRLSESLDRMIEQKRNPNNDWRAEIEQVTMDILDSNSWISEVFRVKNDFMYISDADALVIIPELIDVLEKKKKTVMEMNLDSKTEDEILFNISRVRKTINLDKRLRDITKRKK